MRLHRLVTEEVQPLRIVLADAQVIGHHLVMLARGRLVEGGRLKLEGIEEKQRRIGQRIIFDSLIFGDFRFAIFSMSVITGMPALGGPSSV